MKKQKYFNQKFLVPNRRNKEKRFKDFFEAMPILEYAAPNKEDESTKE